MPEAARLSDLHTCPMQSPATPPVPHVGGAILGPGVPSVHIGFLPAATMGDTCLCTGPPATVLKGAPQVLIGGRPAARRDDPTSHGGRIQAGCPTVIIGDGGGAPGGSGSVGSTSASGASSSSTSSESNAPTARTHLRVVLLDHRDHPVLGENVQIHLDDGRTISGRTDEEGTLYAGDVEPGSGRVTFPDLDEETEHHG